MTISYRPVFQNFVWFLLACAAYRLICWTVGFRPFPSRDLFAIAWGYFGGGISLRYFLNNQFVKAAEAPDSKSAWEDGRIGPWGEK